MVSPGRPLQIASVRASATKTAPIRVVRTRFVDEIVLERPRVAIADPTEPAGLERSTGDRLPGWSGIEGLGAIMVIPGIAALTAANYEGKERAFAYSMIGGAAPMLARAHP